MLNIKYLFEEFLCKRDVKKLEKKLDNTTDSIEISDLKQLIKLRKALNRKDFRCFLDNKYRF